MIDDAPTMPETLSALREIATVTRSIAQRAGGLDTLFCFGAIIDKFVKIYEEAAARGEEFRYRTPTRVGLEHVHYLSEKFARTFGPMFAGTPAALRMFVGDLIDYGYAISDADLRELGHVRKFTHDEKVQLVHETQVVSGTLVRFGGHDCLRLQRRDGTHEEHVTRAPEGDKLMAGYDLVEVPQ